ncbi:tumor necrosis factor receptor superfamily member wengen [Toxorhynchites rutilus septentrionalis]|uniref:tumor necrosis factor receptor superfamily member wengen n=1 Tax=Toxorhynchites rutilus septentrionalis TaxID=329112 RepID=UPI00247B2898|nr:tumor necrosis factor receptor superfamily member wengen [Toxorhynchites rutilus septentrionalis]
MTLPPPWIVGTMESTRHPPTYDSDSLGSTRRSSVKGSSRSVSSSSSHASHRAPRWITVVALLLTVLSSVEAICESDRWWNPEQAACVPCRICGEQQLVLRPCQEYMDTVCGTMQDLDMDLGRLGRTEGRHDQRHWKEERRKDGHHQQQHDHLRQQQQQQQQQHAGAAGRRKENTAEIMWDWQAASLLLAIIGCLLFFFAAAIIALNQTRQWKRIEKHFDADMEALSAQLMNHLSSMQQLENGSIFLDDVIDGGDHRFRTLGGGGHQHGGHQFHQLSRLHPGGHGHRHQHPIEVRCVYLDQLLDGKSCIKPQGTGNLYIEENNDRGPPSGAGGGGSLGVGGSTIGATPSLGRALH